MQNLLWQRLSALPLFLFFNLILSIAVEGAYPPPMQQGRYVNEDNINNLREAIENLRHQVNNHDAEIHVFDEKLANIDSIIDGLRDQFGETNKAQKEMLKGNSATLESKIAALETAQKGMMADLKQFKTYSSETATALAQYKQKIAELDKSIELQNQNIEHLQAAMRSLMEALQVKEVHPAKSGSETADAPHTYKVKNGDSLEKIAKANQTTVQAIKELNNLTTDKIVVGKVLQLP